MLLLLLDKSDYTRLYDFQYILVIIYSIVPSSLIFNRFEANTASSQVVSHQNCAALQTERLLSLFAKLFHWKVEKFQMQNIISCNAQGGLKKSLETLDQTPKHCRVHVGELKLEKSLQDICKLATQHCMCARVGRGDGFYPRLLQIRLGQIRLLPNSYQWVCGFESSLR